MIPVVYLSIFLGKEGARVRGRSSAGCGGASWGSREQAWVVDFGVVSGCWGLSSASRRAAHRRAAASGQLGGARGIGALGLSLISIFGSLVIFSQMRPRTLTARVAA